MTEVVTLRGGCHCGKIRIAFETAVEPTAFTPWACDCSFCLKHGATYVSDRAGRLSIEAKGSDAISEYRQGSQSARFLVCRSCGVLVAVLFDADAGTYGTVNSKCIDSGVEFGAPQTVSPQKRSPEERRKLWAKLWTPGVTVKVSGA